MFIMVFNSDTCNKVIPVSEYIQEQVIIDEMYEYINNGKDKPTNYNITINLTSVIFSIRKYDYITAGLQGNYDDFYEYKNGYKTYIITFNEGKLRGFCNWINRLTEW